MAEATGGDITTSGIYTIHTFLSSGTFTPISGNGEVEYLVIAGGASGGNDDGTSQGQGGGGAGGYRTNTGFSVSQGVGLTVTVGAGGWGRRGSVRS